MSTLVQETKMPAWFDANGRRLVTLIPAAEMIDGRLHASVWALPSLDPEQLRALATACLKAADYIDSVPPAGKQ